MRRMKSFYREIVVLLIIFLLGASVRFIGLGVNPAGLTGDEAENGYDAYSLIRTDKDQWGAKWPITSFRGFGDYRLPAYTYLSIIPVKLFSLTPFAVRFPSALFGSLTIFVVFGLGKQLIERSKDDETHSQKQNQISPVLFNLIPLLSAFFLAISPWHIAMSRVAIEQAVSVFFISIGFLTLLKGRHDKKWIVMSSVIFGLCIFIYRPNIFLVPFLMVFILYLYRNIYKVMMKEVVIGLVCGFIVASPILLSIGSTAFKSRANQIQSLNDTGSLMILNEKRGACNERNFGLLCTVIYNKYVLSGQKLITNYLYHFSPNLLSIEGTETQYSVLPRQGLLYFLDYPLLIVSVIALFMNISRSGLLLLGLLLFTAIPDSFTSSGHYGRFFISYPVWPLLFSFGIAIVLSRVKKWYPVLVILFLLYGISFSTFIIEYSTYFPYKFSQFSHYGYEDLTREIESNKKFYDRVIVSGRVNDAKQYIYYLFFTQFDPILFQSGKNIEKVEEEKGWVRVKKINNIEFLPSFPNTVEMEQSHVLLIGAPTEFPDKIPVVFKVSDKKGSVVFQGVDLTRIPK